MTDDVLSLKHFFDEARDGRLTGIRCGKCGELSIPPRELCPACHQSQWETVPLSGDGTVSSYTIIRVPPRGHAGQAPYAVAVVRLAEGVSILGRIVDTPFERLAIGLPVRFRPIVTPADTLIAFAAR